MNPLLFIHMNTIALLLAASALADRPNEELTPAKIPLDQIWAYDMPGTRKIGELDAVKDPNGGTAHPIVKQIVLSLASRRPKEGETVGPVFVVRGTDKQALENACDVITRFIEPGAMFPSETDLTLVFYSVIGGGYVHIAAVEKSEHLITVKYRFVSHNTRDDSLHFALIPLGQLPADKYEVKIEQIGSVDAKGRPAEPITRLEHVVCRGTSFTVWKKKP